MQKQNKPICVVLTGAGISVESGLPTYRAENGLWNGYKIEEVCTPEGLERNPEKVIEFYNQRRADVRNAQPNLAHLALVELEKAYQVEIITQNVDDLHERAGSRNVLHLHGEISKLRSVKNPDYIIECKSDQTLSDVDDEGYPLRPNVVFFGEMVPMFSKAEKIIRQADVVIVIGTSLQVSPANTLIHATLYETTIYVVDPNPNEDAVIGPSVFIKEKSTIGVPKLVNELLVKRLSYDSDWSVREVIAERDDLDEDIVNRLAQDDNE